MEEKIRDGIRRRSEELDRITTLAALEDWLRRASAFRSVRQSYLYYHPEFRDSE